MTQLTDTKNCFEYSDYSDELKQLLSEIKVSISEPDYKKYFLRDTQCRNVYRVTMTRGKTKINFLYGDSISNTEKGLTPDLYSILSSVGCEYHMPDNFEDFISELGYENTAETKKLFKKSLAHSLKLKKIYTNEEIECLPS